MSQKDFSLYEPFERLVKITIERTSFDVPENNLLLRCIQYIADEEVVPGRFCWNNECGNCELTCHEPGKSRPRRARGCQTTVVEGMVLSRLTRELSYWLEGKLT